MNILIIESCEKKYDGLKNTSIVHVRNSLIIQEFLGCDLLSHISEIPLYENKKYDVIICMYASPYMKYDAYLPLLLQNSDAKMFWLVNDHDLEDNILLRKWSHQTGKQYHVICNNPREGYRGWILRKKSADRLLNDWIDQWYTLNLNTLIFDINTFKDPLPEKEGIVYYGTFRKNRLNDLRDYNGLRYDLSASKKNHKKFQDAGIEAKFVDKLDWQESENLLVRALTKRLCDYKYSLYIEDVHTHENYAFMANRFYECLMHKTILFYDYRCYATIKKSGYEISSYQIVHNSDDMSQTIEFLENTPDVYNQILETQNSNVIKVMEERNTVLTTIRDTIYENI